MSFDIGGVRGSTQPLPQTSTQPANDLESLLKEAEGAFGGSAAKAEGGCGCGHSKADTFEQPGVRARGPEGAPGQIKKRDTEVQQLMEALNNTVDKLSQLLQSLKQQQGVEATAPAAPVAPVTDPTQAVQAV